MNEAPKPAARPKRSKALLIGVALLAVIPVAGFVALLMRGNPCSTMLANKQMLKLALESDVFKAATIATTHSCSTVMRDASGQVVLSLQMRSAKVWDTWLVQVEGNGFSSTPLALGDTGMLYEWPGDLVPASMPAEKVAEQGAGQRQPRQHHGPQSVALIMAGPNALQLIVHGPPERARQVVDKVVGPQLQLLRDASF